MLVAGTGTGVGKTWVAAHLIVGLRTSGAAVAARKPAQSFEAGTPAAGTDAGVLASASGELPAAVCPPERWFEAAMAPPMAADALGLPAFGLRDLADGVRWPDPWGPGRPRVGVVETAGGVRSPLAADGDTVGLVELLRPDLVVLVADAGLGTINAVRLSAAALGGSPVVVLNRADPSDDLHARNHRWLAGLGLEVMMLPGDGERLVARALGEGWPAR